MGRGPRKNGGRRRGRGRGRWLGAVARLLARVLAFSGLVGVLAWLVGLVLNDRFPWSQWLWWMPTLAVAGGAWGAIGLSRLVSKRGGRRMRRVAIAAASVATVWVGVEMRPWNALNRSEPAPGLIAGDAMTIAYWNLAASSAAPAIPQIEALGADVLIIANAGSGDRGAFSRALQDRYAGADDDPRAYIAQVGWTTIASRFPIVATGRVALSDFETAWAWNNQQSVMSGVSFVELATGKLLGDAYDAEAHFTTVWIVDLPSSPRLHRPRMLRGMAGDLENWDKRITAVDEIGRWTTRTDGGRGGFPSADLIVGDFNTPRGSTSLRELVADRVDLHQAVGVGLDATFLRPLPFWAIDLAFANTRTVLPVTFEAVETGYSYHRAIRAQLRPLVSPPPAAPPQTSAPSTGSRSDP